MTHAHKFSCSECIDLFPDLVDGVDSTLVHQQLRQQLHEHSCCLNCFDAYQLTATICRETLRRSPAPDFGERLLAFLLDRSGQVGR